MTITRHILSVNHSQGRFGEHIQEIIIHTMVGTVQSAEARFSNPSQQVSAHYGIDSAGLITQWVSEGDTAWHAGDWDVNTKSIGIEHQDNGDYNGVRPDSLYAGSAELVADICRRNGIPCDRAHIRKHSEVHATGCPDALDIDRIVRQANEVLAGHPTPQNPVPTPPGVQINPASGTFTVTVPTLRVHNAPNTADAGTFANTPDGMLHQGNTFGVTGWCVGSDPYGDGRNIWLVSIRGRFVWQGGTNAHFAPAEPTPAPSEPVTATETATATTISTATEAPTDTPVEAPVPAETNTVADEPAFTPKWVRALDNIQIMDTTTNTPAVEGDKSLFIPKDLAFKVVRVKQSNGSKYYQTPNMVSNTPNRGVRVIDVMDTVDPEITAVEEIASLGFVDRLGAATVHAIHGQGFFKWLFANSKKGGE